MFNLNFTESCADTDLNVLLLGEKEELPAIYKNIDDESGGIISKALSDDKIFDGKFAKTKTLSYIYKNSLRYILIVGLGSVSNLEKHKIESLGGKIYSLANCLRVKKLAVDARYHLKNFEKSEIGALIASGAKLASYRFDKYRTNLKDEDKSCLETFNVIVQDVSCANKCYSELEALISGIFLARDVISAPGNVLYPESYARIIKDELTSVGAVVKILGESEMRELGMGALLGVGQGSAKESKLVVIEYFGSSDSDDKPIAFVGKGVTFDTGGICIKPSAGMWEMKYDMAGSAAVVGVMKALAIRRANVNAIGVVGLVENMPGGNAQRPGDVVKTMSGKTVEVIDTDAEGRLVLSDALWYTQDKYKPQFMVDLATLTGAIVVALGNSYAGCFSNNEDLSDRLLAAGKKTDEKLWPMPLHQDYEDMIKSDIADIANLGNVRGAAGSSTAAQFLKHFVNDIAWAHLDIAGMAWDKKGSNICPKGAVGFGIKLLNQLVKDHYETN